MRGVCMARLRAFFLRLGAALFVIACASAQCAAWVETAPAGEGLPLSLPLRRETADAWQGGGIGIFAALAVVIAIAALVAWGLARKRREMGNAPASPGGPAFLRKFAAGRPASELRLVQSVRLTPRASAHVIQWGDRQLLVGCAEQGVNLLAERTGPAAGAAPDGEVPP